MTFRFWQEGPGYDRNLTRPAMALAAIDYLHNNPVRRGLVKEPLDWKWSSARYYLSDSTSANCGPPEINPLPAEWLQEGT